MNVSLTASTAVSSGIPFWNSAVSATVQIGPAGRRRLYMLDLVNSAAAVTFVQVFFLPSASVVLGTTVPDMTFVLSSTAAGNAGQKQLQFIVPVGDFLAAAPLGKAGAAGSGLTIAATTTANGATTVPVSVAAVYS